MPSATSSILVFMASECREAPCRYTDFSKPAFAMFSSTYPFLTKKEARRGERFPTRRRMGSARTEGVWGEGTVRATRSVHSYASVQGFVLPLDLPFYRISEGLEGPEGDQRDDSDDDEVLDHVCATTTRTDTKLCHAV